MSDFFNTKNRKSAPDWSIIHYSQPGTVRFKIGLFFKKNFFAILNFIYFQFLTPNKQIIVFFRTRPGEILIWQKFS